MLLLLLIIWLVFVADKTRAVIGQLLGHYSPVKPKGHYGLCKLAKQTKVHPKAAFVFFLQLILRQNTMSEDELSDSEFYYPDKLESHKENSEAQCSLVANKFTKTAKKKLRVSKKSKKVKTRPGKLSVT